MGFSELDEGYVIRLTLNSLLRASLLGHRSIRAAHTNATQMPHKCSMLNQFCYCFRLPRSITANAMAVEAMQKMEAAPSPVTFLPVVDFKNVVIGLVTLHGLVSAGL